MKVAVYFNNAIYGVGEDYTNVEDGNPGIGGAEYMALLLSYLLYDRVNSIEVILYANQTAVFKQGLEVRIVASTEEAIIDANNYGFDRFVCDAKFLSKDFITPLELEHGKLRIIPWLHNFVTSDILEELWSIPSVGRIISVSEEQLDIFRDNVSFQKSDYIFNCVPVTQEQITKAKQIANSDRKPNVVFIGSLTPYKNFHILAELWPNIKKRVPDAELYVIGSANLYDKVDKLGRFQITEESYENSFMPFLSENGEISPSVHFLGKLGKEKNDILLNCKVGVPNPPGYGETFSIAAVEMQSMGCSVTGMRVPGYMDTIFNGYIADTKEQLEDYIVKLLLETAPRTYDHTIDYVMSHFSMSTYIKDWEKLLLSDLSIHIHNVRRIKNLNYRLKWLKEIMRYVKDICPILYEKRFTVEGLYSRITKKDF